MHVALDVVPFAAAKVSSHGRTLMSRDRSGVMLPVHPESACASMQRVARAESALMASGGAPLGPVLELPEIDCPEEERLFWDVPAPCDLGAARAACRVGDWPDGYPR